MERRGTPRRPARLRPRRSAGCFRLASPRANAASKGSLAASNVFYLTSHSKRPPTPAPVCVRRFNWLACKCVSVEWAVAGCDAARDSASSSNPGGGSVKVEPWASPASYARPAQPTARRFSLTVGAAGFPQSFYAPAGAMRGGPVARVATAGIGCPSFARGVRRVDSSRQSVLADGTLGRDYR